MYIHIIDRVTFFLFITCLRDEGKKTENKINRTGSMEIRNSYWPFSYLTEPYLDRVDVKRNKSNKHRRK